MLDALAIGDVEGILDGGVDLLYVIYGTFISMGVDLEPLFTAVHENNMKKVWHLDELGFMPEGAVAEPCIGGYSVTVNGKVIKPPSWKPVKLLPLVTQV